MYQKILYKFGTNSNAIVPTNLRHNIDANQTHWDAKKHMEQMLEETPESILRNLDMGK